MTELARVPPPPPDSDLGQPLPGWYPNPADLTLEQWWTGVGWAEDTRPAPQPARAPSANRAARTGSTLGYIAVGLILLIFTLTITTWPLLLGDFMVVGVFAVGAITFIIGVTATIVSGVGLGRASERGGRGAAVEGLVLGLIAVLTSVVPGGFIVFAFWVAFSPHA
jgi:hypothetical protein